MTTWSGKRGAKKLAREAQPGQKLYTVCHLHTNLPIDKEMYSEHTVGKGRGLMSAGAMLAGPGYMSVEQLVYTSGTVYSTPPPGMRNIADPLPQIAEPIPGGRDGSRYLSRSEITALEKEVQRAREETGRY